MSFERQATHSQFYNHRPDLVECAATAGLLCAALASFFLLVLVSGTLLGLSVPEKNLFLLVWTAAFGAAFAALFLSGAAASRGRIPVGFISKRPIQFGVLVGLLVLIIASMAGSYFLVHGRKASLIPLHCPQPYQPFQAKKLGFAFCHPAQNWTLNVSDFGAEGRGFLLHSKADPQVKVHFRLAAIPDAFIGESRSYIESVVAIWRKLDPKVSLNSVYFAGKEAFYFEANFKDIRGLKQRMQALHILLSKTKILFVNSSHFENTSEETRDVLIRVVSTMTFAR